MAGARTLRGKDVLDVGCAYGGFLIAAHEAVARRVCGIDINEGYLAMAKQNFADHGLSPETHVADITDPGISDRLGQFDAIFCNDVIEHVKSPTQCATNLSRLLAPGGRVYLQIPNATCVDFMLKDGHYGVFGLTLLDREQAERLWTVHYGSETPYGVEHYAPIAYYVALFSAKGVALKVMNDIQTAAEPMFAELSEKFDELERRLPTLDSNDEIDQSLRDLMRARGKTEIERFRRLACDHRRSTHDGERDIIAKMVALEYREAFWQLSGRKDAAV